MRIGDEVTFGRKTYTVAKMKPFVLAKGRNVGEYVILPLGSQEKSHDSERARLHIQHDG